MSDDRLIVPIVLTPESTDSLKFVDVPSNARAQDVIEALLGMDGVKQQILGDLDERKWALQRLREEHSGRPWEESELEALNNGVHIVYHRTCGY